MHTRDQRLMRSVEPAQLALRLESNIAGLAILTPQPGVQGEGVGLARRENLFLSFSKTLVRSFTL